MTKLKKTISKSSIKLEYTQTMKPGTKINFKWYDKDLCEFTEHGVILESPLTMPVLKVLGDDKRTYIIAKEWVINEEEENEYPYSEDLSRFSNDYL